MWFTLCIWIPYFWILMHVIHCSIMKPRLTCLAVWNCLVVSFPSLWKNLTKTSPPLWTSWKDVLGALMQTTDIWGCCWGGDGCWEWSCISEFNRRLEMMSATALVNFGIEVGRKLSLFKAALLGWQSGKWVGIVDSNSLWHHWGSEEPTLWMGREYTMSWMKGQTRPWKHKTDRKTKTGFPSRRMSREQIWWHQCCLRREVCPVRISTALTGSSPSALWTIRHYKEALRFPNASFLSQLSLEIAKTHASIELQTHK